MASARAILSRRFLLQLIGGVVGLALLAWCISIALRPENRAQLSRLREASPGSIAGIAVLSLASLVANGAVFWSLIRPVKRLGFGHMCMVNSVATCLAYLPFKLSLIFRFFIHRTRDHIPVFTISAWLGAAAASMLCALGPIAAAGVIRTRAGSLFVPVSLAGVVLASAVAWVLARLFAGPEGLARIRSFARKIPLAGPAAASPLFGHMHAGFDMIASWRTWSLGILSRLVDVGIQAARFYIAAQILQADLSLTDSILIAVVYYSLGAAAPSGAIGVREGGAMGLAKLLHIGDGGQFAAIVLLVSAADVVPTLGAAIASGLALGLVRSHEGLGADHPSTASAQEGGRTPD